MDVAKQVVKNNPATVEDLLAENSIAVDGKTVNEVANENTVNETKYAVNTSQVENRVTEGNSNSS